MTTIRAPLSTVLSTVRQQLETEAKEAAKNNLLSKSEQATLADGVLKEAAETIRQEGGSGARVDTDVLVEKATSRMEALIGSVNQPSGSGAVFVSQAEVKALASAHPDAGVRVARAYELITGKKIDLGGAPPVVTPDPVVPVDPVTPTPVNSYGDVSVLLSHIGARVEEDLRAFDVNQNGTLTLAEIAQMNDGVLEEAARGVTGTRTIPKVSAAFVAVIADQLRQARDPNASVPTGGPEPLSHPQLVRFFALGARDVELSLVLDAIAATTGARPVVGDFGAARTKLHDAVDKVARAADSNSSAHTNAPSSPVLSAAERATLPAGMVRDVANALPTPVQAWDVANAVTARVVDAARAAGIDVDSMTSHPRFPSLGLAPIVFDHTHLERMAATHPDEAGLLADVYAMSGGRGLRPSVPGLPAPAAWLLATP
jgi:hypothetical protein